VFEHNDNTIRALFKHGSFDVAEELKLLLDDENFFFRPATDEGEQKVHRIYA